MELRLERNPSSIHATLGQLYVNGEFRCYTLEDPVREIPGQSVDEWKIPGATAIPTGRYKVAVTISPRFGRRLPLLYDVPGFAGVRIHPGNTADDTEGCILVGRKIAGEAVIDSRAAFADLFERIEVALQAGEAVWIEINNPPARAAA